MNHKSAGLYVINWDIDLKKKTTYATERERADVQLKRAIWVKEIANIDVNCIVFIDESGINIDMARRYGRNKGKKRVIDYVPLNTPKTITLLSSIRLDGSTVVTAFEGALNGDRFIEYLRDYLIPTLQPGDIVIMDNLSSHKVSGVADLFNAANIQFRYLPPYSPDFNPIEKMWSKVKAYFRKSRLRTVNLLYEAVPNAFGTITCSDCRGWFSASGY